MGDRFGRQDHFWNAIPGVKKFRPVVEAYEPGVRAGAERKDGERVSEFVFACKEVNVIRRVPPHELAVVIEEGNPMMTHAHRDIDLHNKLHHDRAQRAKDMGLVGPRLDDFPSEKTRFGAWATVL